MIKKLLIGAGVLLVAFVAGGWLLYAGNAPPATPPISAAAAADPDRPYIVKLHAQWCPICLVTKDVWSELAADYEARANLVVFDFTDEASTSASEAEARRLGLGGFFADYVGTSGAIAVLDGGSRELTALIGGNRSPAEYRAAIEASLAGRPAGAP